MGYDVFLTRAQRWHDSARDPIPFEEWQSCCQADPSLQADDPTAGARGAVRWADHPAGVAVSFVFQEDCVRVADPDQATLLKMVDIATALNARVVGDDGEVYTKGPDDDLVIDDVPWGAYSQTAIRPTTPGENRESVVPIGLVLLTFSLVICWRLLS